MNATAAPKYSALNKLEGLTLSAGLKALPAFTTLALLLKLAGGGHFLDHAEILVVTASVAYALFTGPIFPKLSKTNWEPLFFDASLSFSEKILRWRTQPAASLQLLINTVTLAVLGLEMLSER
jgi:hypothetical protein